MNIRRIIALGGRLKEISHLPVWIKLNNLNVSLLIGILIAPFPTHNILICLILIYSLPKSISILLFHSFIFKSFQWEVGEWLNIRSDFSTTSTV